MRTVITGMELMQDKSSLNRAIDRVVRATGAHSVSNGFVHRRTMWNQDAIEITVGFDPKGWTGR
jgi:hypothetical protein